MTPRSFEQVRLSRISVPVLASASQTNAVEANDNARLSLFRVGSVAMSARTIAAAFKSQSIFMAQRVASAVFASPLSFWLSHRWFPRVVNHTTTGAEASVPQVMGGALVRARH